jgi:arylsulfatase A-like enzyme
MSEFAVTEPLPPPPRVPGAGPPAPLFRLVVAGIAGAAVGALVAAFIEARSASGAGSFGGAFLAAWGLLWPVALVMGVVAAGGSFVVHPGGPRSVWRMVARSGARRWVVLLAGPAVLLTLYVLSRAALGVLAAGLAPAAAGACLAGAALVVALIVVVFTEQAAGALSLRREAPALGAALAISLLAFGLGFAGLVAFGETGGAGRPWDIFGVLRRQELNLRPLGTLLTLLVFAYVAATFVARAPISLLAALGLLPALGLFSARSLDQTTALAFDRAPGLVGKLLPVAQRVTDRDKDGFSAKFGGGDCDDANAEISPRGDDAPGNGIDEDCSGRDAEHVTLAPQAPAAPASMSEWIAERLPEKANVLVLSVDTLRWDLGYAGNPRPVSPNVDALAKRSAVFERAYSLASYTSKSLGPAFIGKYASEAKRTFSHFDFFAPEERFLQERLHDLGLRTVSVQGYWYFTKAGYGFERGFDLIDASAQPKTWIVEGDTTVNSDKLADATIKHLEDPALEKQQFYFWTHFVDAHADYVPHAGFDFGSGGRARYDGEVAFIDAQIGRILDALAKRPFADRTIVIFTSDHGEAFGEHGMWRHGFELWDELVRVPLVIHVPGIEPRRITTRRSSIDLVPTVLEAVGHPLPAERDPDGPRGVSLLPDVMAPPGYEPKERIILVDMPKGPYNEERVAFIEDGLKLVTSEGRVLGLYDLNTDPGEKKDLREDKQLLQRTLDRFKAFQSTLKKQTPVKR